MDCLFHHFGKRVEFGFGGRRGDAFLRAGAPANRSSGVDEDETGSGLACVLVASPVGVGEAKWVVIGVATVCAIVANSQFESRLEVSNYALCCLPVLTSEGVDVMAEGVDGEGDVGSCGERDVVEAPYDGTIRQLDVFVVRPFYLW